MIQLDDDIPIILIALKENGQNGGPYNSHKRIIDICKSQEYILKPFYFPKLRKLFSIIGMIKIVKEIKKINPVAVQIVGLQLEGFITLIACKLANVKTILAIHGSSLESCEIKGLRKFIYNLLETYTIKNSDISFGVSDYVSNWKICQKSKNYYGTIYNLPKNLNYNNYEKDILRRNYNIDKKNIVITSTGRITIDKGYDILMDVITNFKEFDYVKFILVGDGDYKKNIEEKIFKYNLKNVYALGFRENVDEILSISDIFIICTKHETLCMSLQEAGRHGIPMVATNVGGIPEIIDDTCGILVEKNNVEEFTKALSILIDNPHIRNQMGINAANKIKTKFSEEGIISKLNEIYIKAIRIGD